MSVPWAESWLKPMMHKAEFGFATLAPGEEWPAIVTPHALFVENEGTSFIAPVTQLAAAGLAHRPGWALISLGLETALDETGITAAVSAALDRAGIPANIVAAYHHDHLFVPWERRDEAAELLRDLPKP